MARHSVMNALTAWLVLKPQISGTTEGLKVATFEPQQESPSSTKGIAASHLPQKKWVLSRMSVTEDYTRNMESQRKRNAERKTTKEFKRVRRNSRKKRNLRKNSVEAREGVTYIKAVLDCSKPTKTMLLLMQL